MNSLVIPEKQRDLNRLGLYLARTVREYFKDPEHERQFREWYKEKYGQEYIPPEDRKEG